MDNKFILLTILLILSVSVNGYLALDRRATRNGRKGGGGDPLATMR